MDKKERKSIKNELKDIENMRDSAEDMINQMSTMCVEIANVGSMFANVQQRDIDYIIKQADKFEDICYVEQEMLDEIFKYASPFGYWKPELDNLSMTSFRTFYRNVSKKYDAIVDTYEEFFDMYDTLARERFVKSKAKLRKV